MSVLMIVLLTKGDKNLLFAVVFVGLNCDLTYLLYFLASNPKYRFSGIPATQPFIQNRFPVNVWL